MKTMKIVKLLKSKQGVFSTAVTAAAIAVIIAVYALCAFLSDKYSLSIDTTADNVYKLSESSKQTISDLKVPVSIYFLASEAEIEGNEYYSRIYEYVKKVCALSDMLSLETVDLSKNAAFLNNYTFSGISGYDLLIIESEKRYRTLSEDDLYGMTSAANYTGVYDEFYGEKEIISAIAYTIRENLPNAYMLSGHNEATVIGTDLFFKEQNYTLSDLSLLINDIPEDADLIILSCPERDYSVEELDKLRAYMKNGGNMIVFMYPGSPELANLEEFFGEFGVKYERVTIMDPKMSYSSQAPNVIFARAAQHEITNNVMLSSYIFTPQSDAITITDEPVDWLCTPLLTTSDSAYGKRAGYKSIAKAEGDLEGRLNIAVLCEYLPQASDTDAEETFNGKNEKNGKIIFFGTPEILYTEYLSNSVLSNAVLMENALNYMVENDIKISIPAKSLVSELLIIREPAISIIFYVLVVLMPAVLIVLAVFTFFRRAAL